MKKTDQTFRLARLCEAERIALMSRDLIEHGLTWRWTPHRVAASIRAPDVNVLVACKDQRLVGFAIMRYANDDAHLDLLAVAPRYQRAGVGRKLVAWLEECAVVAGIFSIALEVRAGNHVARNFYSKLGYQPVRELPRYYQGREAAVRMVRDLSRRGSTQNTPERRQP